MWNCKRVLSLTVAGCMFCAAAATMSGCSKKSERKNPAAADISTEIKPNAEAAYAWNEHTRARAALEAGEYDAAMALAEARLKADSKDALAYYILGRAQMGKGDVLNASRNFEKAREILPTNDTYKTAYFDSLEKMASSAMELGVPFDAAAIYEMLYKEDYHRNSSFDNMGKAYMQSFDKLVMSGQAAEGEEMLKKTITRFPEHVGMKVGYAEYLMSNDRLMEADRLLKALNNSHPDSAAAAAALGRLSYRMGDLDSAKNLLERAISLDPNEQGIPALQKMVGAASTQSSSYTAPEASLTLEQIKSNIKLYRTTDRVAEEKRALDVVKERFPNEIWALLDLSYVCDRLGIVDEALKNAESFLVYMPESQKGQLQYARCLYQNGRLEEASGIISRLEASGFENPNELLSEKGQIAARMGNFDDARALWSQVLNSDPNHSETLFNYGQLEMEAGNSSKASEFFAKAVNLSPNNNKYRYFAGMNLIKLGRKDAAAALWQQAVSAVKSGDPYAARIVRALGDNIVPAVPTEPEVSAPSISMASLTGGRSFGGGEVIVPAHVINESVPSVDVENEYSSALGLARAGRFSEAAEGFRKVLSMDPNNFNALMNLGKVYTASNRQDIASAVYLKALKLNPTNIHALNSLANSYADVGIHNLASQITEQVKRDTPEKLVGFPKYNGTIHKNDSRAIEPVARAFMQEGLYQEAFALVSDTMNKEPSNNLMTILLGDIYMGTGAVDKAAAAYRKAQTKEPQSPLPYIKMGDLYASKNKNRSAVAEYDRAMGTSFINAESMFAIADRFVSMGYTSKAQYVWNRLKTMYLTNAQVAKLSELLGEDLAVTKDPEGAVASGTFGTISANSEAIQADTVAQPALNNPGLGNPAAVPAAPQSSVSTEVNVPVNTDNLKTVSDN